MLLRHSTPISLPNNSFSSCPAARSQLRSSSVTSSTFNVSTNDVGRRRSNIIISREGCWLQAYKRGVPLTAHGSSYQKQRTVRCQVGTHVDGASEGQPADEDEFLPPKDDSAQDYVDFSTGEWAGTFTVSAHLFVIPPNGITETSMR